MSAPDPTALCPADSEPVCPADGSTSDISASVAQAMPIQARNYHKSISENKEIVKLVSVLSTSINSTKKVSWLCSPMRRLAGLLCCVTGGLLGSHSGVADTAVF